MESASGKEEEVPTPRDGDKILSPRALAVRVAMATVFCTAVGSYLGGYIAVYTFKPDSIISRVGYIQDQLMEQAEIIDEYVSRHVESSADLVGRLEDIVGMIGRIPAVPKELKVAIDLAALESKLNEIEVRLATFQGIVTDNPEKAMFLPVMRNDIEVIRREIARLDQLSTSNADGMYNLLYAITAMNLTMLLAFAGLVGWTFVRGRRS